MTDPPADDLQYWRGRVIFGQALEELIRSGYGYIYADYVVRAVHDTYTPDISDSQWLAAVLARVLGHGSAIQ